jgi:hypothetical protein
MEEVVLSIEVSSDCWSTVVISEGQGIKFRTCDINIYAIKRPKVCK